MEGEEGPLYNKIAFDTVNKDYWEQARGFHFVYMVQFHCFEFCTTWPFGFFETIVKWFFNHVPH